MKFVFVCLLLAVFLIPAAITAQVQEAALAKVPATKLEAYLYKKGTLLVHDFYSLGEVKCDDNSNMIFSALVLYEPVPKASSVKGLKIEIVTVKKIDTGEEPDLPAVPEKEAVGSDETDQLSPRTTFVDFEEIKQLSQAIAQMLEVSNKWKKKPKEYSEVFFTTKDGLRIGFSKLKNEVTAFIESSSMYYYFPSFKSLKKVKEILDKGYQLLMKK